MTCLDRSARTLIQRALEFLRRRDMEGAGALEAEYARVDGISTMARNFPSLMPGLSDERAVSSPSRLVKVLCTIDTGMSSLHMPVRAVMGGAVLTGKVQLFLSLHQKLRALPADSVPSDLLEAADKEMSQSIHMMLLAGLLWDLVRNRENRAEIRERAATELVRLWEDPDQLHVADFFPVLEAVWQARNRVKVTYGSLMGVTEFFQLVREECPALFISFFTRDDISPEESAAFQEFLFGIPHEELNRLRKAMDEKGIRSIDRKFAEDTLKLSNSEKYEEGAPQALYASHRRRQRAAELRRLTGFPGPRNTAEAYLILHLLEARFK